MLRFASSAVVVVALGVISACYRPSGAFASNNALANTRDARAVDALWMIELPPVTVVAPGVERETTCPAGEGSAHPHKKMGKLATLLISGDSEDASASSRAAARERSSA